MTDAEYKRYVKLTEQNPVFNRKAKALTNNGSSVIIGNGTGLKISMQFFYKTSKDFPTIILPRDEYAHVMSELATHMSVEDQKKSVVKKAIGNHIYTIENHGFGEYRIIGKRLIGDVDIDDVWGD